MVDSNNLGSNGFTDTMEGESIVALVKLGMWNGRTVHNGFVVSKHETLVTNRDSKVTKRGAERLTT